MVESPVSGSIWYSVSQANQPSQSPADRSAARITAEHCSRTDQSWLRVRRMLFDPDRIVTKIVRAVGGAFYLGR